MKKIIIAFSIIMFAILTTACFEARLSDDAKEEINEMIDEAYRDGYEDGYNDGYDLGFDDGKTGIYNKDGH